MLSVLRNDDLPHCLHQQYLAGLAILLLACSLSPGQSASQSKTAPTSSLDPIIIDQIWQKGRRKYDRRRAELVRQVDHQASAGPFRPDWQSLAGYQVPDWYKDSKFGIFIHWGLYSVPAFGNEWYPRNMYIEGSDENKHHLSTYGPLTKFGYKDFIPMFKAEHFDPQSWARLFKQAGAKYVVPVFEHHDGFAMYDSGLSDWNAAAMGPHRDLVGELAEAIRSEGLHLGAATHRIEHDWFLDGGRKIESDVNDPDFASFYGPAQSRFAERHAPLSQDWTYVSPEFAADWLARDAEIVEKYHPEIVYFDFWIGHPALRSYLARFAAFYYNESSKRGTVGVINYKADAMQKDSAVLDVERGQLAEIRPKYWQTDTSLSNKSWGYIQNDTFKTPGFVVHELVDIVSKNGNLLLNIGPRSDGTIPEEVQQALLEVGGWLKLNGEAIYGTRPWTLYGEGPTKIAEGPMHDTDTQSYTAEDFRFTTKGGTLYAIEMAWPSNHEAVIHSLGTTASGSVEKIDSVKLLGSDAELQFEQRSDGLHIQLPEQPPGKYAYVFRLLHQDVRKN